jgi:hypothetical protein
MYSLIRTKRIVIKDYIVESNGFKIHNLERTLLECLNFSTKLGRETVLKAFRKSLKEKKITLKKMLEVATKIKLKDRLLKDWEAITLE